MLHGIKEVEDVSFFVRGTHNKTYRNAKYPAFASLTEEKQKKLAVAVHRHLSVYWASRFIGATQELVLPYDDDSEPGSDHTAPSWDDRESSAEAMPAGVVEAMQRLDSMPPPSPQRRPDSPSKRARPETAQERERAEREGSPTKKSKGKELAFR